LIKTRGENLSKHLREKATEKWREDYKYDRDSRHAGSEFHTEYKENRPEED